MRQVDLSDTNLDLTGLCLRGNPYAEILGKNEYYGDNGLKYYDITFSKNGIYHRESFCANGWYYDNAASIYDIIYKSDYIEVQDA